MPNVVSTFYTSLETNKGRKLIQYLQKYHCIINQYI